MSKRTVLHVIHNLNREGAQQVLFNLVRAGVAGGERHIVCPWRRSGPLREDLVAHGVTVLDPPAGTGAGGVPLAFSGIVRAIGGMSVDLIHAHMSDAAILTSVAARTARRPYIVTHHSNRLLPIVRPPAGWVRRALFTTAVTGAAANVAVSPEVADRLAEETPLDRSAVRVIENGVAIPPAEAVAAARAARKRRRDSAGSVRLVVVGRLIDIKGQDQAIDAVARLRARYPGMQLILAGDGPMRAALEQRAAAAGLGDAVVFAGVVRDVAGLLAEADLYVSTSHYEGLPMALLEAMAWGLPVVASDVRGNRDVVADGRTGRLYPLHDIDRLTVAIEDCLTRRDADALGEAARTRVVAENGADAMARRYGELYQTVLASAAAPSNPAVAARRTG